MHWLVWEARDLDGRLAVTGPLKLSHDPRVITWYQHTLEGEGYLLWSHQRGKLVRQNVNKVCVLLLLVCLWLGFGRECWLSFNKAKKGTEYLDGGLVFQGGAVSATLGGEESPLEMKTRGFGD